MGVERDPRNVTATHALRVAQDDELLEMPAVPGGADTACARLLAIIEALPVFPAPAFFGLFLVAVIIGQRAERGEMLRPVIRETTQGILAVESATGDAEVRRPQSADAQIEPRLGGIQGLLRRRVPVFIEMGQKRRTRFRRAVVPELQL